jgi:hypothetical protein
MRLRNPFALTIPPILELGLSMRDNMLPTPQVQESSPHLPTEHTAKKKVIDGLDTL